MKKSIFVESILLLINGGTLNDESAVMRADIEAYLPIAVNYAMTKGYNLDIRNEGSRDISGSFVNTFYDLPIVRPDGRRPNIELPKGVIALPRNQGIRMITNSCGQTMTPLSDADMMTIDYYQKIFPCQCFFRLKKDKIEFYGMNELAETVSELDMIVRVEDLDDDDELPLPAGVEEDAYRMCLDKFDPQRKEPSDKITDSIDLNTVK